MAELPKLPFQEGAEFPLGLVAFPPTWVVIDNGHPSDAEVSKKIVSYLRTRFPPVLAVRRVVPTGEEPDPMDLMAHGVIVVGGPAANPFLDRYLARMDPTWENRGTEAAPMWWIVKGEPIKYETNYHMSCLITSCRGTFPWLRVYNVAGQSAYATVDAGDLFCAGETRGVWINKTKVADP